LEEKYRRDIEESDALLDSNEGDPINFWEEKQRELVASQVDYNLGTLTDLIQTKAIDLSPAYQRRFRWDEVRQSKLIESFLMNVPVPPIFLNEDRYGQYSVIDGKQRLNAIFEFLRGRLRLKGLEIFSDINGKSFDSLPLELQTVIKTRPTLRAVIILRQSDEDVKFEVFQRLNSGGVLINPQEIRNSTYPGPLNDMILDLSINKKFHALLGIKVKEKSAIYQEMRDAELVLRYLTLRENWEDFSGGIKRAMDHYMSSNAKMNPEKIEEARNDFLQTLDIVEACFGELAFKRWLPERGAWKQQILAALYDAEMLACKDISIDRAFSERKQIIDRLKNVFTDKEFSKSISANTNTPSFLRTRTYKIKNILY